MKPFTLESVLSYRVQLEKIAVNRLYQAEKKRAEAFSRCQQKETQLSNLTSDLIRQQATGIDVTEMVRYMERIDVIKNELVTLKDIFLEMEKEVLRERENTIKKSKERKVMEKLKEKQNAAWRRYLDKKEAAMIDEIAVMSHEKE